MQARKTPSTDTFHVVKDNKDYGQSNSLEIGEILVSLNPTKYSIGNRDF